MSTAAQRLKDEQARRKREQRARLGDLGISRREVEQSWRERGMADFCAHVRGGLTDPYDFNEYVNTLIRRDYERLKAQLLDLQRQVCRQCGKPAPLGCQGAFTGEADCWRTRGYQALLL